MCLMIEQSLFVLPLSHLYLSYDWSFFICLMFEPSLSFSWLRNLYLSYNWAIFICHRIEPSLFLLRFSHAIRLKIEPSLFVYNWAIKILLTMEPSLSAVTILSILVLYPPNCRLYFCVISEYPYSSLLGSFGLSTVGPSVHLSVHKLVPP